MDGAASHSLSITKGGSMGREWEEHTVLIQKKFIFYSVLTKARGTKTFIIK
jgi:hypothetical protein